MEFLPDVSDGGWHTWWGFSPDFFVGVLRSMGFPYGRVTHHTQRCFGEPASLFTVVASRSAPEKVPPEEAPVSVEVCCPVERLRVEAGGLMYLPVRVVNRGPAPISSSSSPALMSYHWRRGSGELVVWDGVRTPFPRTMYTGDEENLLMSVRAPAEPGLYLLEVTVLREGVMWYDDQTPGLPLRIEAVVTPGPGERVD